MTNAETAAANELTKLANAAADKLSSDILFINHYVGLKLDEKIFESLAKPSNRKSLVLVLVTEGGDAHTGYRCMRYLHARYENITIVVPGWCKSAGTLMCTGAHRLQIGPLGELGPLDVQLVRADTGEVSSGLALGAAIEKLQREASDTLLRFMKEAEQWDKRISLPTAVEIAKSVTIGMFQPVFDKLEPISIGEDYRAYQVAAAYVRRLNFVANNLRVSRRGYDGLQVLLDAYPSHRFVIDKPEASSIFHRVDDVSRDLVDLIGLLGRRGEVPLDRNAGQNVIEFLNERKGANGNGSDTRRRSTAAKRKR